MGNEEENLPVATQITERIEKAIQKLLADNAYVVMADCIRDLIRKDLQKRRLLDAKEESYRDFYTQTTSAQITFC